MKYSFVIPTYNKKDYLQRTLEALNHQEGFGEGDYEAIVIDDGSDDDVFSYIKKVNSNYRLNYIYLERCRHSCRARTRNYGINAARGKYIAFIDDDIVVSEDYLKQLDRYYQYGDNLTIVGNRINCPVELLEKLEPKEIKIMAFQPDNAPDMLEERHLTFNSLSYNLAAQQYPWMMTVTCSLSVPKKQLTDIGGFDEKFNKWGYEDLELGYRLYKNGAKFVVNSNLLAFHQVHPRAPAGENNFAHFVEKCNEIFDHIDPTRLLAIYGLNTNIAGRLKIYRNYKGEITNKNTIIFREKQDLQKVKKKIREFSREKGCEVTVRDQVESTDLDIWLQMQQVDDAILNYMPESFSINRATSYAVLDKILFNKPEHVEKIKEVKGRR
jgi:glycosyltransferase involved in cell wall biosynthesis